MPDYPFTCRDGHEEIGFITSDRGQCPLCFLRDQILLELAQPRANYELFGLQLSSAAIREWPYKNETSNTKS